MTPELDPYALYSLSSRWRDICHEAKTTELGLRHNSTTFLTPGGGKAPQVFDPPFPGDAPPTIVIWLTGIRLHRSRPWRVRCRAEDVTSAGFTAVVESWDDSELEAAGVAWVAYGEGQSRVWSGGVRVQESGWICPLVQSRGEGEQQCGVFHERRPMTMAAVNEFVALQVGACLDLSVQISWLDKPTVRWDVKANDDAAVVRVGCVGIAIGEVNNERLPDQHGKSYKGVFPRARSGDAHCAQRKLQEQQSRD